MTLQELSDQVAAANTNWNGLTNAIKQEFGDKLRAQLQQAFNDAQRDWFKNWWLRVTAAQLTTGNGQLPPTVRVSGRLALDGLLYVNADLLTDCQAGETYQAVRTSLHQLPLRRKFANEFSAPPVTP